MKYATMMALVLLVQACGAEIVAPVSENEFRKSSECRISCNDVPPPSEAFQRLRYIVSGAENHDQCNDADLLTTAYVELDGLYFDDFWPTPAINALAECLAGLD